MLINAICANGCILRGGDIVLERVSICELRSTRRLHENNWREVSILLQHSILQYITVKLNINTEYRRKPHSRRNTRALVVLHFVIETTARMEHADLINPLDLTNLVII